MIWLTSLSLSRWGFGLAPRGNTAQRLAGFVRALPARGLELRTSLVGNFFTSLDMNGVTITLTRLDEELLRCLSYPCRSLGLTVVG